MKHSQPSVVLTMAAAAALSCVAIACGPPAATAPDASNTADVPTPQDVASAPDGSSTPDASSAPDVAPGDAGPTDAAPQREYRLTIFGDLAPATIEETRVIHNATAGDPTSSARARSLGDLSHRVYVPVVPPTMGDAGVTDGGSAGAGPFLILDIWNDVTGLNTFFSDPMVQAGGAMIFRTRDPIVWDQADGFTTYHTPAPADATDRFYAVIRGTVRSRTDAQTVNNMAVAGGMEAARMLGDLSHDAYWRLVPPGSPPSNDLLIIDVWTSLSGLMTFYSNPDFQRVFGALFTAPPSVTIWQRPAGDWTEWGPMGRTCVTCPY